MLEVSVVDVSIDAEKSFEDNFDNCFKVAWERNSKRAREDLLIIQLIFNPRHQEVDILSSTDF